MGNQRSVGAGVKSSDGCSSSADVSCRIMYGAESGAEICVIFRHVESGERDKSDNVRVICGLGFRVRYMQALVRCSVFFRLAFYLDVELYLGRDK